ncbi:hypothetical protein IKP85_04505 [bacterium]|nr:hypothetical protein [bacterium]
MVRKLVAILILFLFSMNYAAFGDQTWLFDDGNNNNVPYTNTSTQYPTNPISDEQSFRGSVNTSTYLPQPVNTQPNTYVSPNTNTYYNPQPVVTTTTPEQKGSFVEEHPVLTGVGAGALLLGLVTVGLLLSDDDDDYYRRNRHSSSRYDSNRYYRDRRDYHSRSYSRSNSYSHPHSGKAHHHR